MNEKNKCYEQCSYWWPSEAKCQRQNGKLLKILGIKTKDSVHKNSMGSLFFPMKMLETPFQHMISGSKEKALGVLTMQNDTMTWNYGANTRSSVPYELQIHSNGMISFTSSNTRTETSAAPSARYACDSKKVPST